MAIWKKKKTKKNWGNCLLFFFIKMKIKTFDDQLLSSVSWNAYAARRDAVDREHNTQRWAAPFCHRPLYTGVSGVPLCHEWYHFVIHFVPRSLSPYLIVCGMNWMTSSDVCIGVRDRTVRLISVCVVVSSIHGIAARHVSIYSLSSTAAHHQTKASPCLCFSYCHEETTMPTFVSSTL